MATMFDQQSMIDMFAKASAQGGEQLRKAVSQATLAALQGRELTLKNIRSALGAVTQAANASLTKGGGSPLADAEGLLDKAVAGMDDALLKAVEANRVALQRLLDQGADLREKHLKKAIADLDKFDEMLMSTVQKGVEAAGPLSGAWSSVMEKLEAGGSLSGMKASATAEQMMGQMQTTMRETRAAGIKAVQTLAEGYATLVSGVLIGMSDALTQGGSAGSASSGSAGGAAKKSRAKK